MDSFLPDFEEKGILIGTFYTPNDNGVLVPPKTLSSLLEEELENYR
ncbi:hypothetical protein SAMN04515659_3514 [Dyella sp. 333MFSha]|nr:hypothetical protein SAMN04515659_3514 [Dyella sp. 333MFSha]